MTKARGVVPSTVPPGPETVKVKVKVKVEVKVETSDS